jgi:hypothetical protein
VSVAMVALMVMGGGCSTDINRKAFASCQPRNIGIVLGYDLHSVSQTAGQEFLVMALVGVMGAAVANDFRPDKPEVENNAQVNGLLVAKVVAQLEGRGYATRMLTAQEIEYNSFENSGGKAKDFDRLVAKYGVASPAEPVDTILFVEGYFEFRFFEPAAGETLSPETVQTKVAEVKLHMFDRATKQLLFKRFAFLGDTRNLNRVADDLIRLDQIPAAAQ